MATLLSLKYILYIYMDPLGKRRGMVWLPSRSVAYEPYRSCLAVFLRLQPMLRIRPAEKNMYVALPSCYSEASNKLPYHGCIVTIIQLSCSGILRSAS